MALPNPTSVEDLVIPSQYKTYTSDGVEERFLLADSSQSSDFWKVYEFSQFTLTSKNSYLMRGLNFGNSIKILAICFTMSYFLTERSRCQCCAKLQCAILMALSKNMYLPMLGLVWQFAPAFNP